MFERIISGLKTKNGSCTAHKRLWAIDMSALPLRCVTCRPYSIHDSNSDHESGPTIIETDEIYIASFVLQFQPGVKVIIYSRTDSLVFKVLNLQRMLTTNVDVHHFWLVCNQERGIRFLQYLYVPRHPLPFA